MKLLRGLLSRKSMAEGNGKPVPQPPMKRVMVPLDLPADFGELGAVLTVAVSADGQRTHLSAPLEQLPVCLLLLDAASRSLHGMIAQKFQQAESRVWTPGQG